MTENEFWSLIGSTRCSEAYEHAGRLTSALAKLGEEEILSFGKWWYEYRGKAYSWKLWGAAYLMNGGCSDDGFIDFRSWLLLQGQTVYEAALKDPESLAELKVGMDEASCECYPFQKAFAVVAPGKDFNESYEEKFGPSKPQPELGKGWDFDDDEEMTWRYPRLSEQYRDE